jgi:hypothetical protein
MAKDKKSFILYADILTTVAKLKDAKAGRLFKMILEYVNDKNPPESNDLLVQIAFEPIKQQLKRDLKDWEEERSKRSASGKLGGIKSGESRRNRSKRSTASENEANEADNVTVTVNDNVTVMEGKQPQPEMFFSIEHCLTVALNDDRWVKANKAKKEDLEEFNHMLERTGVYQKNPRDYKSHFSRWRLKGKLITPEKINGSDLSVREKKGMEFLNTMK